MQKQPAIFCWSGGKDSSYALYKVQQENQYEIKYLLSTINGNNKRLSMHGIREELIEAQANSIGIPLLKVYVYEASNAGYENQMRETLLQVKSEGINTVLFGDIFLEDLREYRENKMKELGMQCEFPLWKMDTAHIIKDFVQKGFKTYLCCVNEDYLDESQVGKLIDGDFIKELPATVDPCGENGEFHTYCFEGPIFQQKITVTTGEKIYKPFNIPASTHPTPVKDPYTKGFWYCDIHLQ